MLDPVESGELRWQGRPVASSSVPQYRSRVLYLHQSPVVFEGAVRENLMRPFELRQHAARQWDEPTVVGLLRDVGRDKSFLDKPATELSGGERQLLAIIRAVQLAPEVLLLDEPTAAMDDATTQQVEAVVKAWHTASRAYVWASHSPEQTKRVAHSIWHINAGVLRTEEG